ncbi:MAG: aminotransferase class IV [Phycisphaerales bacterium]
MPRAARLWHGRPTPSTSPHAPDFNPANKDILVNINGRLVHRDQAGVSPFDSAVVQGGDAVWEGLWVYGGRIFRLKEHLDRLRASALLLAFSDIPSHEAITPRDRPHAGRQQHARRRAHPPHAHTRRQGHQRHGLRDYQSGLTLIVLAEHKKPVYDDAVGGDGEDGGLALATASVRQASCRTARTRKIHHCNLLQSILAKIEANAAGADDALMLDTRGFVAETNATHVFIVVDAEPVHTPGRGCGGDAAGGGVPGGDHARGGAGVVPGAAGSRRWSGTCRRRRCTGPASASARGRWARSRGCRGARGRAADRRRSVRGDDEAAAGPFREPTAAEGERVVG